MANFSITKDQINDLPLLSFPGKSYVIRSAKDALNAVLKLSKEPILGFDTETRPAFKKNESYPISLLQLATKEEAFLFRLNHFPISDEIIKLLENPKIKKVGVAIRDDIRGLQKLKSFQEGGFVELADLAKDMGVKNLGLRSLAGIFLKSKISKKAKLSNWAGKRLDSKQILYAATDAWVGRELYIEMSSISKN